ncbi:sigma-54 interaction domain-containing protein [Geosporobacter ferrireducens]|uniref:Sigma-54-dependent Fis family transcriptional regulator n=1 Tax=Geosporobacter ferrireducens TaxID=1424294 RepID=A0A1D8GFW3_9FIRM|nr:sigma 54-interacting transcriptional regulator [Geosporobacter ferrireducens]AOT69803.1 sigma-54-dependent Fis family transcriptional regulator [Geosporobacter ferrireducens]
MPDKPIIKRKKSDNKINEKRFHQIFDNLPDPIFVTDQQGNILLSNSTTALTLNMSLNELLKANVNDLVHKSYYDKTYTMEAVAQKKVVSGLIKTRLNYALISTSTPILDESGNVDFVITSARPKELMEKFIYNDNKNQDNQRKREIDYLRSYVLNTDEIIAESISMKKLLISANAVAQTDVTVILNGETGTGKEVLARYLHRYSKRANGPFIAVNCATLPEHLVEAELFGYEKGAFTGATNEGKMGLFEAADGGTLFLDEIAELPLALQSKLLRVLETGEVRRISSHTNRIIDFRLIAATHKDLKKMTEEKLFREDLYYRLNVFPLIIPPLRKRPEDILALTSKFLETFNNKYGIDFRLTPEDLSRLQRHNWPGNVRELKNDIERRVVNSIHLPSTEHLTSIPTFPSDEATQIDVFKLLDLSGTLDEVIQAIEEKYITYVMNQCDGRINETAKQLGIHRSVLYRKLKAYEKK